MKGYVVANINNIKLGDEGVYVLEYYNEDIDLTLLELIKHKRIGNKTKVFKVNFKFKNIETDEDGIKRVSGKIIEQINIEKELQKIINKGKLLCENYLDPFFNLSDTFIERNLKDVGLFNYFAKNNLIKEYMIEEHLKELRYSDYAIDCLYYNLGKDAMDKYFECLDNFDYDRYSLYPSIISRYRKKISDNNQYTSSNTFNMNIDNVDNDVVCTINNNGEEIEIHSNNLNYRDEEGNIRKIIKK